jgi:P2-related tail formation protein
LEYNLKNNNVSANGYFRGYQISGKFKAKKIDKRISLKIYDVNTTSISKLVKRFKLKSKIEDWIIKKSKAKFYQLKDFNISGTIIDNRLDNIYCSKCHNKIDGVMV